MDRISNPPNSHPASFPPTPKPIMPATQSNNNTGGQYQYDPYDSPRTPRRTPMACQFCRARKLKCDGLKPQCTNCNRRGYPCNYVPVAGQGAR